MFKESFLLYSQRDRSIFELELRYLRHQVFIACIENLPQFFLQLWESFALGYTFGFWKAFSIMFSITIFQWNSGQYWPYKIYFLKK